MNQQPSFFDAPAPPSGPLPPVSGKTRMARRASESGARMVVKCRSENVSRMLQLLREPLSRQQLHQLTGIPINSVCSLLEYCRKVGLVVSNGDYRIQQWKDGSVTKQERFRSVSK